MKDPLYAIGDVHGRADLLEALLAAIDADAGPGARPPVVFLGDIVDRGPDSRAAMDLVAASLRDRPGSRFILGNHDEYLLQFARSDRPDPLLTMHWLGQGGAETLASYGIDPHGDPAAAARTLRRRFAGHVALLEDAEAVIVHAGFAFAHAGVDPALPLDRQDPHATRWIREAFLNHANGLSHIVVHGHTQTKSRLPEIAGCRIGLDTGAYATGRLTCAVIAADRRAVRFLATRAGPGPVTVENITPLILDRGAAAALLG